jgi:GNAT superfamily N-acetyltransferase
MALATWWRGDALPRLVPLPGLDVQISQDEPRIAHATGLDRAQLRQRLAGGHQPYLATIAETPVGYGWVAQQEAEIGELGLRFTLPPTERYLWDFATLPAWQGYGIYPRLLQSVLAWQAPLIERVWILYAPENTPSGVGIHKAGLLDVGQLSFRSEGGVGLVPLGALDRAQAGAALLGVPIIEHVAPCWACSRATPMPSMHVDPVC